MKLKALLQIAVAAAVFSGPVSAQNLNLQSLGITMPKPGAQMMCDRSPSDDAFKNFHCPLMAEAMWWGDPKILKGTSRAEQFMYISAWITAVHEPSVVWKVDPTVYSQLDPRLPMHVRYLAATSGDVMGEAIGERLNLFLQGGKDFLEVRRQAVESGTMNPLGEMMALLGGVANAPKPITLTSEIANHDVMAWIGLAQRDPDAAIQLYQGIRNIALSF